MTFRDGFRAFIRHPSHGWGYMFGFWAAWLLVTLAGRILVAAWEAFQ
jgi:hypothetical protein